MFQRAFVRENLLNSNRTPENLPENATILPNREFDLIYKKLRTTHDGSELPHPISQDSTRDSSCEIGYVKSGYNVRVYLIKGGVVCLVDEYQGLSLEGDVVRRQINLFHEDSTTLESLCKDLIDRKSIDVL